MADRSVSISLRLQVAAFLAGERQAKGALTDLDRKLAETSGYAKGFRTKLEAAFKKLPKIEIDASSAPAETKLAELRAKLEVLSAKTVGVDLDASDALSEMVALHAELETLQDGASFEVRAAIGKAIADLHAVEEEVRRLAIPAAETGSDAGGAFARSFRSRLEAGFQALPKATIDADATPAQAKLAELRNRMQALSSKTIGIDLDANAALAQMRAVQSELQNVARSGATIDIRADAAAALSELAAIESAVSAVDGRTARTSVDADVSGALAKIAMVSAALAALPAAVTIGAGIAGLGAAFGAAAAGAGGFAAVAIPSMGRVTEAVKEMDKATGSAGGATKSLAQSQADAASKALQMAQAQDRVKDALAKVKDAQRDVARAQRDLGAAQADVSRAIEDAASRHADALRRVADAERQVGDAQRDALRAQQAVNDARKEAARDLEDLGNRLIDTNLDLRGAQLDLTEAQAQLNATMKDPRATEEQKKRAQLNYDRAVQRINELKLSIERLNAEQKQADKDGVEGSKKVTDAKDALADANRRVAEAQQAVVDAQRDVAKVDEDNARRIADAQQKVIDAHEKVADAQRKVSDAQRDAIRAAQALKVQQLQANAAMNQAGGAAGGAASKFSELSKAEQKMAKDLKKFQDGYKEWQQSLEGDVFPAITGGLSLVSSMLPKISPLVKSAAGAFVGLEEEAKKALRGKFWDDFLKDVNKEIPGAITGLGHTAGNILTGMAGAFDAVLPHSGDLIGALEKGSEKFAKWGQELKDSPDFKLFVEWVKATAPEVAHLIGDVAVSAKKIVEALAPFGVASLGGLSLLAKITSGMSPTTIQAIATAVAAIYTAVKVGGAANAGLTLLGNLRTKMADAGTAAGGAKGKLSTLIGMVGTGGVLGAALGAGVTAFGLFTSAQDAAKRKSDELRVTLNKTTGAVTSQSQETVKQSLIDDGTLERAKKLGLNLKDVTDAALGNEGAMKRVNQALLSFAGQGDNAHPKVKALGDATKTLSGDALLLQQSLIGSNGALADARTKLELAEAASGRSLTAQRDLTTAYGEAKSALDGSNGKLDINAAMTDKQKDAVARAKAKFDDLLTAVRNNAEATFKLTGRTSDSTEAIARQLPKLFDLAGHSKAAKDEIYKLAEKYGISKTQADKAAEGGKKLKEVLDKLKSPPPLKVSLDTAEALKKLYDFQLKLLNIDTKLPEGIAAPKAKAKKKADGGVSFDPFAAGGITSFAAGAENHVAQVAPAGAWRVWAEPETGGEGYIPLAPSKRARSTEILGIIADEFGYQLAPKKLAVIAAANGGLVAGSRTPVYSPGGSSGGLTVSIDNLGGLTASLDATSESLNERLAGASGLLLSTLGDAGTVTKRIEAVGTSAGKVAASTATGTAKLAAEMSKLTAAINKLTAAVSKAGAVAKTSTTKTTSTKTTAKKTTKKTTTRSDPNDVTYDRNPPDPNDATYDRHPPKPKPKPKPTNQVDGYSGSGGSGSIVGTASYAGSSAALMEMADRIGQAAGTAFGSVMAGSASRSLPLNGTGSGGTQPRQDAAARRSAPQMGNPSYYGAPYSQTARSGSLAGRLAHEAAGSPTKQTPVLHIENYHPPQNASPRHIAEEMSFIGRRG